MSAPLNIINDKHHITMKQIAFIVWLIMTTLPIFSQELTVVAPQTFHLQECTPDPYFYRGQYSSKERGDIVSVGDTITIYAYRNGMDWTFVYNHYCPVKFSNSLQ